MKLGIWRVVFYASVVAIVAMGLNGCAADDAGGGEESCDAVVDYSNARYERYPHHGDLTTAEEVEGASLLGCDDTNGKKTPDEPVAAWTLDAVSSEEAIAVELGDELVLFVSEATDNPCSLAYVQCS